MPQPFQSGVLPSAVGVGDPLTEYTEGPGPSEYTIFSLGGQYMARNGTSGLIDYSTGSGSVDSVVTAAAATGVGTIRFTAGTFVVNGAAITSIASGTVIKGAGRNATIIQNTGTSDMWSIPASTSKVTFQALTLLSNSSAGHIFAPAGSIQTFTAFDVQCIQNNPAKSIWKHGDFGYIDSMWLGCILTHNGATSVPAFDFTAATISRYNSNTWQRCQANNTSASATWFFDFATSSAADFNYDNVFRDITFEINNGGCARVLTGHGFLFETCNVYDLTTTVNDLFVVGAGGGALTSRNTMFLRCGRRGGALGGGKSDVALVTGGKGNRTSFIQCNTANVAGYTIDLQNNTHCTLIDCGNVTVNNAPSSTVSIDRGRVLAEAVRSLYKAGAPVDGDFSVTPADGTLTVDSTNNKIWCRIGGVWKGVVVA